MLFFSVIPCQVLKFYRRSVIISWYSDKEVPYTVKQINIKLSLAENVKTFVNVVNRYPYDMDLRAGRHVVDAKSILGIFSLDLSKPITLEVYTDECEDLVNDLTPFLA